MGIVAFYDYSLRIRIDSTDYVHDEIEKKTMDVFKFVPIVFQVVKIPIRT